MSAPPQPKSHRQIQHTLLVSAIASKVSARKAKGTGLPASHVTSLLQGGQNHSDVKLVGDERGGSGAASRRFAAGGRGAAGTWGEDEPMARAENRERATHTLNWVRRVKRRLPNALPAHTRHQVTPTHQNPAPART